MRLRTACLPKNLPGKRFAPGSDVEALGGLVVILEHDRHGQLTISENADLDRTAVYCPRLSDVED